MCVCVCVSRSVPTHVNQMEDITDIDDRMRHQGTISFKTTNPSVLVKVKIHTHSPPLIHTINPSTHGTCHAIPFYPSPHPSHPSTQSPI